MNINPDIAKGINPRKESLTLTKIKELTKQPDMSSDEAQEIYFAVSQLNHIVRAVVEEEALKEARLL